MVVWADQSQTMKSRLLADTEVNEVLTPQVLDEICDIKPYLARIDVIYKRLCLI